MIGNRPACRGIADALRENHSDRFSHYFSPEEYAEGLKRIGATTHEFARFVGVSLRQPDEPQQPVQPAGRIALPQVRLPILDERAFAQDGCRGVERAAGDHPPQPGTRRGT